MTVKWREYRTVSEVIPLLSNALSDCAKSKLSSDALYPLCSITRSRRELEVHEHRLGQSIPEELKELFELFEGVYYQGEKLLAGHGGVHLQPLEECKWEWPEDRSDIDGPEWDDQIFFIFARSVYGDRIAYCERPPHGVCGTIIIFDFHCVNDLMLEGRNTYSQRIIAAS